MIIGKMVKESISKEVKDALKYCVKMDSTQDVGVMEQCSIILRYVRERDVQERLIALINVKCTTGKAIFTSLKEQLEIVFLSVSDIISSSFHGAANMSGCYNGVEAHIRKVSCNSVYTWCYAHILKLVVVDITQCVIPVNSLFGQHKQRPSFPKFLALVNAFIEKVDNSLDEMSAHSELEKSLPEKKATGSIEQTFSKNEKLIQDLEFLDPRHFSQIREEHITADNLKTIADLVGVDPLQLKSDFLNFKDKYSILKKAQPSSNNQHQCRGN
ncbi:hypothetical protein XELAEV_18001703mg [Xenopus laevis]|nr:hypothetical protein XELAEV_18001703mg [Xenopus laevis]